jgi:very-short-patch-repair endonuclease
MRAPEHTAKLAKSLRRSLSLPEVLLWQELKKSARGRLQFRKQHPFGPYVLDFYCAKARLCVEIDDTRMEPMTGLSGTLDETSS